MADDLAKAARAAILRLRRENKRLCLEVRGGGPKARPGARERVANARPGSRGLVSRPSYPLSAFEKSRALTIARNARAREEAQARERERERAASAARRKEAKARIAVAEVAALAVEDRAALTDEALAVEREIWDEVMAEAAELADQQAWAAEREARAQLEGNPGRIEHYAETRALQARRRRQEALAMEREIWDEVMKDNASTGVNGDGVRRVTGKSKKPRKSKKK